MARGSRSAAGAGGLLRCSFLTLHQGELLPPVGEVAVGVRAGEVRGGRSGLQRKHVVNDLAQTYVAEEKRGERDDAVML